MKLVILNKVVKFPLLFLSALLVSSVPVFALTVDNGNLSFPSLLYNSDNLSQLVVGFYGHTQRIVAVYESLVDDSRFDLVNISSLENTVFESIHVLVIDIETIHNEGINGSELAYTLWEIGRGIMILGFYPNESFTSYWSFSAASPINMYIDICETLGNGNSIIQLFKNDTRKTLITIWEALNIKHIEDELNKYEGCGYCSRKEIIKCQLCGAWLLTREMTQETTYCRSDSDYNFWSTTVTYREYYPSCSERTRHPPGKLRTYDIIYEYSDFSKNENNITTYYYYSGDFGKTPKYISYVQASTSCGYGDISCCNCSQVTSLPPMCCTTYAHVPSNNAVPLSPPSWFSHISDTI